MFLRTILGGFIAMGVFIVVVVVVLGSKLSIGILSSNTFVINISEFCELDEQNACVDTDADACRFRSFYQVEHVSREGACSF
jgi:hypothetical protein